MDHALGEDAQSDCVKLFDIKGNSCDKYFASFVSRGVKHAKTTNVENCENFKASGFPNFLGVRTPVNSQLKVEVWEKYLGDYWDKQVVHLLKYGFPLDFNRDCNQPIVTNKITPRL